MASRGIVLAFTIFCVFGLPARAAAAAAAVPADAGVSSYRDYAIAQAELLARMMRLFATDIRAGDVAAAQNDYAMTRKYLERIRPLLATQRDLARSMDGAPEDYPDLARDPGFTGFHRLEHGLFARRSTQGLAAYADRLYGDALRLQGAVATQPMSPDMLLDATAAVVETVSASGDGHGPYSHADLWDIEANIDGAKALVAALRTRIEARDPLAMTRLSVAFDATSERLSQLREGCGFKPFDRLTGAEKAGLRATTAALGRELAKLKAVPAID